MLRAHMRAFALLRAQRRLSGCVVVALLILGGISAGHHHRLAAPPDALGFAGPSAVDPLGRAADCVVCRAADPARVEIAELHTPQIAVTAVILPPLTTHDVPASFRPCSPRAPPAAA
jgi:hypothetical protein